MNLKFICSYKNARKSAKAEYDRILEEAGNKADSMIASAKETIRIEREKTIHELKGEIPGLAIASAAKIAGGKSDEERESQLFDQFLRETGEGHGNENK